MKIINRKEFLEIDKPVLFSKYESCNFGDICIKYDSWSNDFIYQDLVGNILCDSGEEFSEQCLKAEKGESIKLDFDCNSRDGLFDDEQLFAVYEEGDLKDLVEKLKTLL